MRRHKRRVRWVHGSLHSTGRLPNGSYVELHNAKGHVYRACFVYRDGRSPEERVLTGNQATAMRKASKRLRGVP